MRGYTIVELVVTIVVIGILAATILPRFANRGDFDQRGAADKVLATLQFARKAAVASRRHVCVSFNGTDTFVVNINATDPDTLSTPTCPGGPNPLQLPFQDSSCTGGAVSGTVCLPSNVTPSANTIGFPVIFDPAGRTQQSGTLTLTGGSLSTEIHLVADTGYVY